MHSVPAFTNGNIYNYLCVINGILAELRFAKSNTITLSIITSQMNTLRLSNNAMRFFMLFWLLSFPDVMKAQEFYEILQDGREWHILETTYQDWPKELYYTCIINGDTIINGKIWKKVYSHLSYTGFDSDILGIIRKREPCAAFRLEDGKLYSLSYILGTMPGLRDEIIQMDFNSQVGDTLHLGFVNQISAITPVFSFLVTDVTDAVLDKFTDDNTRRCWSLNRINNITPPDNITPLDSIRDIDMYIEGIGSIYRGILTNVERTNKQRNKSILVECLQDGVIIYHSDETAVQGKYIISPTKRNEVFDLTGRRLNTPPTRGIYIQNGQKIVVR